MPTTMIRSALFISLLACGLSSGAMADVTVSQSPTAPTEDVYQFQDVLDERTAGGIRAIKLGSGEMDRTLGQGFLVEAASGAVQLKAVTMRVEKAQTGLAGVKFQIGIYEGAGAADLDPSKIKPLAVQTGSLPATVSTGYITFQLDPVVTLSPGKHYSAVFSFVDPTPGGRAGGLILGTIAQGKPEAINKLKGRRWIGSEGTYAASHRNGLIFYVHATP